MLWWITLGGFLLGCLVAYALVQDGSGEDDDES